MGYSPGMFLKGGTDFMSASDKTGMNRYPLSKLVYMYTNAGTLARGLIMVYTIFLCYRLAPMLLAK